MDAQPAQLQDPGGRRDPQPLCLLESGRARLLRQDSGLRGQPAGPCHLGETLQGARRLADRFARDEPAALRGAFETSLGRDPRDIILAPVVSEKSYTLMETGVYTFKVHPSASKPEIPRRRRDDLGRRGLQRQHA